MPERSRPHRLLPPATAAVAALLVAAPSSGAPHAPGAPRATVALTAEPGAVELTPLPCSATAFQAVMANTGADDRFADMTIASPGQLALSRDIFSSYLPAAEPDQPVPAEIEVTAPRDTEPGTYDIRLKVERERLTVPVHVRPAPPKGPGDNLAIGEAAFASSTHGNFAVCGGVDGNADHADWSRATGWNDGTSRVFPDTYGVRLDRAHEVSEVSVLTLDSTANPAARFGIRDWDVQVMTDGTWHTVAEVRGNTRGLVTTAFPATEAEAVQLLIHASNDANYSRVMELEVR
ncbi:hypothetical protein [Streptomyces sp. PT12]|uniref:hypothetical protein n=1 Tax=Streptomyces sp. PT12 TaxID=1510197 RepID=UPI000DE2A7C6|nr:hypothetical protein [Streptomyces sp. PT12]RBM18579.1 hypothetical protein DEH69_12930 [Streptomyces sp. PT12]